VGNITGLTSSSISNALLAGVFTFIGGSLVVFQTKLSEIQIKFSLHVIAAFSIATLFGIYSGIYVSENQLLTPLDVRQNADDNKNFDRKYLRENVSGEIQKIENEVASGRKSFQEAFDELINLLKNNK